MIHNFDSEFTGPLQLSFRDHVFVDMPVNNSRIRVLQDDSSQNPAILFPMDAVTYISKSIEYAPNKKGIGKINSHLYISIKFMKMNILKVCYMGLTHLEFDPKYNFVFYDVLSFEFVGKTWEEGKQYKATRTTMEQENCVKVVFEFVESITPFSNDMLVKTFFVTIDQMMINVSETIHFSINDVYEVSQVLKNLISTAIAVTTLLVTYLSIICPRMFHYFSDF